MLYINRIFMLVSGVLPTSRITRSMKYIMVLFLYASMARLSLATGLSAENSNPSRSLQTIPVELTTSAGPQQAFYEGEEIQFLLSLGDDAYVYMYHVDAAGKIEQILPSTEQASHFYKQGFFLTIPNYENLYRFIVSKPYGVVTIHVFASDQSLLDIKVDASVDSTLIGEIREQIMAGSTSAFGEDKFSFVSRLGTTAQPGKE